MKIKVIVIDGIVESVLTDKEADIEVISIDEYADDNTACEEYADKLYNDPELKRRKFNNVHFDEDGLPLTVGCEVCGEIFELQPEGVYIKNVSGCNIPTAAEPILIEGVNHMKMCRCPNCDKEIELSSEFEVIRSEDMSECFIGEPDNN